MSNFDPSTAEGQMIRTAFQQAVAHIAQVSSDEIKLHVSVFVLVEPSGRRANTTGVQVEIQIAQAPPPEFVPDMIALEKFSKEFTELAEAQGVKIEPPELHRLQSQPNQEVVPDTSVEDSMVWPLLGGALGLLIIAGAVVGYLHVRRKRQSALEDKDQGSPRAANVGQCVDDGLPTQDILEFTNPLKPNLLAKVDEVMAAATRNGIDMSDHNALAKFTAAYTMVGSQIAAAASGLDATTTSGHQSNTSVELLTLDECLSL